MQVQVLFDSPHQETDPVRDLATRRARFALRRLVALAPRTQVRLSGAKGPRGRVDKRCQIKIETEGAGTVVATSMARDWPAAVDDALARAVRRLVRLWRRSSDGHRPRPRTLPFNR